MNKYLALLLLLIVTSLSAFRVKGGKLYVDVMIASGDSLKLDAVTLDIHSYTNREARMIQTPISISIDTTLVDTVYLSRNGAGFKDSDLWIEKELRYNDGLLYQYDRPFHYKLNSLEIAKLTDADKAEIHSEERENGRFLLVGNQGTELKVGSNSGFKAVAMSIDGFEGTYSGDFKIHANNGLIAITQLVELEEYLTGVVASEIGDYAPMEALKAQAVAARTKTIRSLLNPKDPQSFRIDFCNTTNTQVYRGSDKVKPNIREAVEATKGEILVFDNIVIDAVFSSNCGGVTESNQNVWNGLPIPYLQSVRDEKAVKGLKLAQNSDAKKWIEMKYEPGPELDIATWQRKYYYWERNVHIEDLESVTGIDKIKELKVLKRGDSGRIIQLEVIGSQKKTLKSDAVIRKSFGGLPSSLCYFKRTKSGFKVIGRGYGHGVGMCQSGAIIRTIYNEKYKEILLHYYTDVELIKLDKVIAF